LKNPRSFTDVPTYYRQVLIHVNITHYTVYTTPSCL